MTIVEAVSVLALTRSQERKETQPFLNEIDSENVYDELYYITYLGWSGKRS